MKTSKAITGTDPKQLKITNPLKKNSKKFKHRLRQNYPVGSFEAEWNTPREASSAGVAVRRGFANTTHKTPNSHQSFHKRITTTKNKPTPERYINKRSHLLKIFALPGRPR
jgi:hypothetical protein